MLVTFKIIILLVLSTSAAELEEGDKCRSDDGSEGTCKLLTDCPWALELIAQNKFPESRCGFVGSQTVICCKDEDGVTEKSTSTTITTTEPAYITPEIIKKPTTDKGTTMGRLPGEISKEKCKEYAKYAYDRSESPTLSITQHFANHLECAFESQKLIAGGSLATRKEFPHMVIIGYKTGIEVAWSCGGTLISEFFVLTASHCLKSPELGPAALVRLGITNLTDNANLQERKVSQIIYHPDYVAKYHDIGLLKLSEAVEFNTFIRPACLQVDKDIPYGKAIASGWGKIGTFEEGSNDLLKVVLEFFTTEECNKIYHKKIVNTRFQITDGIVDDLMLCAGSKTEIKDTCEGDSGGPLQVYHNGSDGLKCMYNIVGVVAFGMICAIKENIPGVYTRVSHYVEWIEDIVWPR